MEGENENKNKIKIWYNTPEGIYLKSLNKILKDLNKEERYIYKNLAYQHMLTKDSKTKDCEVCGLKKQLKKHFKSESHKVKEEALNNNIESYKFCEICKKKYLLDKHLTGKTHLNFLNKQKQEVEV